MHGVADRSGIGTRLPGGMGAQHPRACPRQQRQRVVQGTRGLAAAVPGHQHACAHGGESAGTGHHQRRPAALKQQRLQQLPRHRAFSVVGVILAGDDQAGLARLAQRQWHRIALDGAPVAGNRQLAHGGLEGTTHVLALQPAPLLVFGQAALGIVHAVEPAGVWHAPGQQADQRTLAGGGKACRNLQALHGLPVAVEMDQDAVVRHDALASESFASSLGRVAGNACRLADRASNGGARCASAGTNQSTSSYIDVGTSPTASVQASH
ncbi:hypothetical protein D3C72_1491770 [compost metagenome]